MLGRSPAPQPRSAGGWIQPLPTVIPGGCNRPGTKPWRPHGGSRASPEGAQTCVCIRLCRGRLGSEFWEEDWEWWEEEAEALLALSNCT